MVNIYQQLSPSWQRSQHVVAEVSAADQVELRVVSESATDDEAKEVHTALLTGVSLARAALSSGRAEIAENPREGAVDHLQFIDLLDTILEKAEIVRRDANVGLRIQLDPQQSQQLASVAAPAVLAGRAASLRTRSVNNLKQIAIAFHNYHDVYRSFPSATQIGPKNTPRSWRVTLLPYLEQAPLYDQYRQDEPWDSPHNIKLLDQMPDVFRCPMDQAGSTNTSYFAYVGPNTVFDGGRRAQPGAPVEGHPGTRLSDILDGTANTLLVVESKQPVPWTRPEDILFQPGQPPPRPVLWYQGGFNAAFCDGAVRFLSDQIDGDLLSNAIMRNDGNPLRLPE